jgi:dTDP-4-amino-4,6-dideoxygalactose transaminase
MEGEVMQIKTPLFKVFMPESVMSALGGTLFSGYIAEGQKVANFRKLLSDYIGNPRIVLVNSCTTALTIAYRLAGVGPGDEVIATPLTCVASNQPMLSLGAIPVWVDVDPNSGMVDPSDIEHLITPRTKAILVLHKEGDPARMDEILAIAKEHDLKVVEDAAHALGTRYKGVKIGNHGDYVCFSFQAIKHITTGDGGAIVCKDENDYLRARKMKWFGVDREIRGPGNPWLNDIPDWGYKGNMNDVAATIGIEQIKYLDEIISAFNRNGLLYSDLLAGTPGIKLIKRYPEDYSTFWAYCLLAENREGLKRKLAESGVAADQIHPRNDVYSSFSASRRKLPNVDYFSERELCLPCGWWVDEEEIRRICAIIKAGW